MSSTKPKVAVVDNDSSGDFDEKETPAPKNKKRASSESKKPAKKAKVSNMMLFAAEVPRSIG